VRAARFVPAQALAAVAMLLLIGVAIWPWFAPTPAASHAAVPDNATQPRPVAALAPAASFAAIGDRPLFSPTRRPAPPAAKAVPQGPATRYRLIGLVTDGDSRRALVADGARRIAVDDGGKLDSGTVVRIEDDRIVLSSTEGETVLTLQSASAAVEPARP